MSRIQFIGGEKGGVGKSVMARLLAQYYIDRDIPFQVFDADLSHGAMMRYYADYTEPVDLSRFESVDRIMERTVETGIATIVDLPAQASKALFNWIDEAALFEMAGELGIQVSFWHVMDDGADTLGLLADLLHRFGDAPEYILVRNHGKGSEFAYFEASEAASLAAEYQAVVLDLPALHAPTMSKIDHISASFWAAANNLNHDLGPRLGLMERQRVRTWLNRIYSQLDRIIEK